MRKKSNFTAIIAIKKYWLKHDEISRGFIDEKQINFIQSELEFDERDLMSLQDLRDFAVCFLYNDSNHGESCTEADSMKVLDCASAVVSVIDGERRKRDIN